MRYPESHFHFSGFYRGAGLTEQGSSMLEVGLLVALICLACVPSLGIFGTKIESRIHDQGVAIANSSVLRSESFPTNPSSSSSASRPPLSSAAAGDGDGDSVSGGGEGGAGGASSAGSGGHSSGGGAASNPGSGNTSTASGEAIPFQRPPNPGSSGGSGGLGGSSGYTISPPHWFGSMGGAEGECC